MSDLSVNAVPFVEGFHRPHDFVTKHEGKPMPPQPPKLAAFRMCPGGDWLDESGRPLHLDALLSRGLLTRRPDRMLQDPDGEVYTQGCVVQAYYSTRR